MADLLAALSFSAVPLSVALVFALVAPPLGATLYLRHEVLLGIALPPAGSAVIALAVASGMDEENRLGIFMVTVTALFLLALALPLSAGLRRLALRRREIVLAAVLCLGNAVTLAVMALSPRAEGHLRHLLAGEIMAAGSGELWAVAGGAAALLALAWRFRGVLVALSLDEEHFRLGGRGYQASRLAYRFAATAVVTASLMLAGPVLTAALLVLPALFAEGRVTGMERFLAATSLLGVLGAAAGFVGGIAADLPPAPAAALGIAGVGIIFRGSYLLFQPGKGRRTGG
jgi:ABC-type Mn2+/Zn2+ transport system permease subunit